MSIEVKVPVKSDWHTHQSYSATSVFGLSQGHIAASSIVIDVLEKCIVGKEEKRCFKV